MPTTALSETAAGAPIEPGVYFFTGTRGELLYIGKAANLRRRLRDHARCDPSEVGLRRRVLLESVRAVRWEVCETEEAALLREADLIVLLRPPFNASHTEQDPDVFLGVALDAAGLTRFEITSFDASAGAHGRAYGCFPHLAKGAFSHAAKRTRLGYNALMRLLWVVNELNNTERIPSRIAGPSPPPLHRTRLTPEIRAPLHDLLSGRSERVVATLEQAIGRSDLPDYMRPALARDVIAARDFFALGPRRIRQFRLRYGLPTGPVSVEMMSELLANEVRAAIDR